MEKISQRWANFARITLWRAKDALDFIVIAPCALVRVCLLLLLRQGGQVRWSGWVRFGDRGDSQIERIQRAKPLAFPSSYVAPTYENSVLVHQVRLDFIIRSFIRYFVIQGIVLDKLYLIKLRITNSKKRAIFLKIYFKYIDVYFHQEILILHIQGPKKKYIYALRSKICPIINIKIYFSTTLAICMYMCTSTTHTTCLLNN